MKGKKTKTNQKPVIKRSNQFSTLIFAWNAAEKTHALPSSEIMQKSEKRLSALFPWPYIYHIRSEYDGSLAGKISSGNSAASTKYYLRDMSRKVHRTFRISNIPS